MKIIQIVLCCTLSTVGVVAQPVEIDFSQEFSWEEVFKSGFRPYLTHEGKFYCLDLNVDLQISNKGGGNTLELNPGTAFFTLGGDQTVLSLQYTTEAIMSVKEAQERMDKFNAIFASLGRRHFKGEIVFDESINGFAHKKTNSGFYYGDWRVSYRFSRSFEEITNPSENPNDWLPFVEKLLVTYEGKDRYAKLAAVSGLITPPPGFEHLSMKYEDTEKQGPVDLNIQQRNQRPRVSKEGEELLISDEKPNDKRSSFIWIITGAIIVVTLALYKIWKHNKAIYGYTKYDLRYNGDIRYNGDKTDYEETSLISSLYYEKFIHGYYRKYCSPSLL